MGANYTPHNESSTLSRYELLLREEEDGTKKPFLVSWLKSKPQTPPPNYVEIKGKHYLVFTDISGVFSGMRVEPSTGIVNGKEEVFRHFFITLVDGIEKLEIKLGTLDGRYAWNFMARIVNPDYDSNLAIAISVYRQTYDGVLQLGTRVDQKGATIKALGKDGLATLGCPPAKTYTVKGKTIWDFDEAIDWMYNRVEKIIHSEILEDVPNLPPSENVPVEPIPSKMEEAEKLLGAQGFKKDPEQPKFAQFENDDLPF